MHQIKLFAQALTGSGDIDREVVSNLERNVNIWLDYKIMTSKALVIQRTDIISTGKLLVYSIYYTCLPNEQPQTQSSPAPDAGTENDKTANPGRTR